MHMREIDDNDHLILSFLDPDIDCLQDYAP